MSTFPAPRLVITPTPVVPVSSPELYAAYIAWRDQDVEDGSGKAYRKSHHGLCYWMLPRGVPGEFENQLETAFPGNTVYPFGGKNEYMRRAATDTQHLNEARIKWVNDRIADYEKANQL